jgi:hypothetical protein
VVFGGIEVLRDSLELNRSLIQLHASLIVRIHGDIIMTAVILLKFAEL